MGIKLHFEPPAADAPGYLRRQLKAREIIQQLDKELSPDAVLEIVEFLVPYIHGPNGKAIEKEEAADYLLDATSDQFYTMVLALMGASEKKAD